MTLQELEARGLIGELARVFNQRRRAEALLDRIGFPRDRVPDFAAAGAPRDFWRDVGIELENGLIANGFEALLHAAADEYPGNPRFVPWRQEESKPGSRTDSGSSLVITGEINVRLIISRARAFSEERGLGDVELGVVTEQLSQLRLPDATPEQALELADELQRGGLVASRPTVVPNQFRDYLLESLYVEGPDTGRFELNDVPASTRVRDIARATMAQYADADEMWPRDNQGHARPAVVDCVETEGSRRLDPDSNLHDNGIEEGATLHVAPQSTAGINPHIRDEALARVRAQVVAFALAHPGFEVEANSTHAPTEYLFRFRAPGWGPPAEAGGEPYPVDLHEVFLIMPPEFPMMAPTAFWQTAIYHPNIHRPTGKVCLGALEDRYRPGMDFGELCQMLVDMASFQNYEVAEGYDEEARNWAVSPEGQIAIEQRGGRSVLRQLLLRFQDQVQEPYPLQIRRLEE